MLMAYTVVESPDVILLERNLWYSNRILSAFFTQTTKWLALIDIVVIDFLKEISWLMSAKSGKVVPFYLQLRLNV